MSDANQSAVISKVRILCTLVKKDLRLFRVPILGLVILGAGCYLVGFVALLVHDSGSGTRRAIDFFDMVFTASAAACGITFLVASVFGGVALASERVDRTAEFIALLPITRRQIIIAKWIASAIALGGFTAVYSGIAAFIGYWFLWREVPTVQIDIAVALWAGGTLALFGIAWLFGSFLSSGPISACLSIGVTFGTIVVLGTFGEGRWRGALPFALNPPSIIAMSMMVLGMIGLIAGTAYYQRRIAP